VVRVEPISVSLALLSVQGWAGFFMESDTSKLNVTMWEEDSKLQVVKK
jgi:hypothetical protein